MDTPSRGNITVPLLLMLALLASVAPFGIDLYLSAFPRMAVDLRASDTAIELTLTMFLLGLAVGQLVFGPVSDKLGRRGPLLVGSVVVFSFSVLHMTHHPGSPQKPVRRPGQDRSPVRSENRVTSTRPALC